MFKKGLIHILNIICLVAIMSLIRVVPSSSQIPIFDNNKYKSFHLAVPVGITSASFGDILTQDSLELALSGYMSVSRVTYIYQNRILSKPQIESSFTDESLSFYSMKYVDYNQDGKLDIFCTGDIANGGNAKSILFRNNGNNTFTEISTQIISFSTASQDWKDFDNDGDNDLIISGNNVNLGLVTKVYRNDLNGSFKETFSSTSFTGQVIWIDYNCDGFYDFIVGNKIFKNQQDKGFILTDSLPSNPGFLALGDYNEDGNLDIVCGYQIIKNINGHFQSISNLDGINSKNQWGDFDNDGDLDLLHGNAIYMNAGNDIFELTGYNWFNDGQLIDFDGDSTLDIWSSQQEQSKVYLNSNKPDTPPNKPQKLDLVINKDMLIFSWSGATDNETDSSGLYYNLFIGSCPNSGDIVTPTSDILDGSRKFYDFGNVGQNKKWILIRNLPEGKYYWGVQTIDNSYMASEFNSTGYFEIKKFSTNKIAGGCNGINSKIEMLDFDNDNDLDYLINGGGCPFRLDLHLNNGSNLFSTNPLISDFYNSDYFEVLDYNKDGILDLYTKNNIYDGLTHSLYNIDITIPSNPVWADYNNDGYLDFVTSKYLVKNIANKSFEYADTIVTDDSKSWIDFDNDRDLDLLDGDFLLKNENGKFNMFDTIPEAGICHAFCDIDNDGDLDIIAGNNIYLNNHSTFMKLDKVLSSYLPDRLFCADFDNNGFVDLLFFKRNPKISIIFFNDGSLNFTQYELQNPYPGMSTNYQEMGFGDTDKDGDLDLILFTVNTPVTVVSLTYLYTNNSFYLNTIPSDPTNLKTELDGFDIIFSWDPAYDKESGGKGLTYNLRVGTTPGGVDIVSPMSDPVSGYRRVPQMGNTQSNLGWRLKDLPEGTYYWSVQAIDQGYMGGAWAPEQIFTISHVSANFYFDDVCEGTPTHFTDLSLTSSGNIDRWKWYFGDGDSSSMQKPLHIYPDGGKYNVTLTSFSGEFQHSISKEVNIKHKPGAAFSVQTVCEGNKTNFINNSDLANISNPVWSWNFGDGDNSSIAGSVDHSYLVPNTYNATLTITADNGCSNSTQRPVIVAKNPVADITSNTSPKFCENDSITLSVTKNDNYLYKWMIDGTGLTNGDSYRFVARVAGNYSVDVTNPIGPCKITSSPLSVEIKPIPVKPVITSDNYEAGKCPGEKPIAISATDISTDFTYQWFRNGISIPNANNSFLEGLLSPGDYTLKALLNGCQATSDVFNIFYANGPEKPFVYVQGPTIWYIACSNDSAASYKWYYNGKIIDNADKPVYVVNQSFGKYQVCIDDKSGCSTLSDIVTVPPGWTGIEETYAFKSLKIYPNPSPGIFTFDIDNQIFGELAVNVFSVSGKKVLGLKFKKGTQHLSGIINLENFPKGSYLATFILDHKITFRNIIVQ
jgi:PKD repeat protein